MSKPKTIPVSLSTEQDNQDNRDSPSNHQANEPLSGSKKVKNHNHSRHNNANTHD